MATVNQKKVQQSMALARDAANGTMEMWVQFDTEEEVRIAEDWMKGKRKVKNLEPLTREKSDKRKSKKRKEIARKMGIKE